MTSLCPNNSLCESFLCRTAAPLTSRKWSTQDPTAVQGKSRRGRTFTDGADEKVADRRVTDPGATGQHHCDSKTRRPTDQQPTTSATQLGHSRPGEPPGLACHKSRLGVLSSRCAQGRAGGTHPSLGQGRRTHPSRRPQAADSSEPPTSRTKRRSIDMNRRRLRDISRRKCPQNDAPPLSLEASKFVRPLRALGFDEPLLDRSRAHPADGPQSQHAQHVFGGFLRQPQAQQSIDQSPAMQLTYMFKKISFLVVTLAADLELAKPNS